MEDLNYTWDEFLIDSRILAEIIAPVKPKSLIIVARGGLVLGGMLSEYLNIPIIETISVDSYVGREKHMLKITKLPDSGLPDPLFVDDIVDTGETLSYLKSKYNARAASLFYKPKSSKIKPDYFLHETEKWVKFPWEVEL